MSKDIFEVKFKVSKKEFDNWMTQMPTPEQAVQIRKALIAGDCPPLGFPEFIGEKVMEVEAGYGRILTLTLQALGEGFRCFRVYAHARMEGFSDSGHDPYAFAQIEPEELYSEKGFALQLYDCGLDIVNVRFIQRSRLKDKTVTKPEIKKKCASR